VALPPDFGSDRALALFDAMRITAEGLGCPLVGGDITVLGRAGDPLNCSVTVLAEPPAGGPVRRSGALAGDTIYVTGELGGSGDEAAGPGRHLTFEPRIAEARQLREALGRDLHAMIDISDGLGRDAAHIARDSGVRIEIDAARIPCRGTLDWRRAASDGEDYELLFAASSAPPSRLGAVPVTEIGRVIDAPENAPGESGPGPGAPGQGTPGGPGAPWVVIIVGDERVVGDELGWQHES